MAKERSRSTPPPCSRALTPDLHAPFHCKVCAFNHANYKVPTCHDAANQDMQRELHWSLHKKIMLLHAAHPTEPRGTCIERLGHPEQRELLSTARTFPQLGRIFNLAPSEALQELPPHGPLGTGKGRGYRSRDQRNEQFLIETRDKQLPEAAEVLHLPQEAKRIPH